MFISENRLSLHPRRLHSIFLKRGFLPSNHNQFFLVVVFFHHHFCRILNHWFGFQGRRVFWVHWLWNMPRLTSKGVRISAEDLLVITFFIRTSIWQYDVVFGWRAFGHQPMKSRYSCEIRIVCLLCDYYIGGRTRLPPPTARLPLLNEMTPFLAPYRKL